jgi:hypothetical protein
MHHHEVLLKYGFPTAAACSKGSELQAASRLRQLAGAPFRFIAAARHM